MPTNSLPPDERPASPPLPQSWCSVVENLGAAGPEDEPVDEPAPKRAPPAVNGLGWKAPSRVPVFERDAAPENTMPADADDETVRALAAALAPVPPEDPDFQEVSRAPAPPDSGRARFQVEHFGSTEPDTPPKGAESAQAPSSCGRDDATPNDGAVPQGSLSAHFDPATVAEMFRCAYWSNGTLEIRTSDGERFLLNEFDTDKLLRYISDALSARARAAA